ncbi:hypothetical protein COLO4_36520 [Corchorus olitorius]|uniref:Uncharacterized protein n=1 Tax=Corchorus olitorius TaxID=93759 RepID=A0A1R3G8E9_9ROSI|nr:hypothetical protein COLO4_36520 [Corchorus olitorius]
MVDGRDLGFHFRIGLDRFEVFGGCLRRSRHQGREEEVRASFSGRFGCHRSSVETPTRWSKVEPAEEMFSGEVGWRRGMKKK